MGAWEHHLARATGQLMPETLRVTFADGTTEDVYGEPRMFDGVLHVYEVTGSASMPGTYTLKVSYPLTAIRKWERL